MSKLRTFQPIVATPKRAGYKEYLPSAPLTGYIRCFWEADDSNFPGNNLVIPDLCVDIIFTIDSKTGMVTDAIFIGVSDTAFESAEETSSKLFAVRFYVWSLFLFVEPNLVGSLNQVNDPEAMFAGFRRFFREGFGETLINSERIKLLEKFLLRKLILLDKERNPDFLNELDRLLQYPNQPAGLTISSRQLERLFQKHIGLAPKQTAKLIRFQKVLQSLYRNQALTGTELAYRHGFADQAHLIKQFKRYSNHTPEEMKQIFLRNVANIQLK
ncbi:AraC family transcriptional regulator [Listeria ivanovii]|uniref:helix-turn-helix domain-containing protein n=1 Tax=Listeria ivanovii TaxID=1638 RepID=UPI000DA7C3E1|nr:helix-turn-helix domain-containing protein [Listeria ivanovii]PZF87277.1 AraC family transcriptional regulator [Listeria ivanovii]PZF92133.1 AraC family transcriptional regulator [Listeria ivanovii]PZG03361.1 AraC family transcriptional regulator [Listeria ivanovii]PZG07532.1 AraC family transcriptional regulator [Listeria ivanovii]PZG24579.1 AraC family transcriptional regulator [Listeria ivanovii]